MTSAANELGIDSHPLTTASPRAQIFFTVFSLTTRSCLFGEGGSAPLSTPPRTRGASAPPPRSTPPRTRGASAPPPARLPGPSRELRAAHDPEVTPLADSQILGLLEVGNR